MDKYELGSSLVSRALKLCEEVAKWKTENDHVSDYRVDEALLALNKAARSLQSLAEKRN